LRGIAADPSLRIFGRRLPLLHPNTPTPGASGDAVEYILEAQGTLEKVLDAYIHARTSIREG
jgi:hypothetical protein